MNIILNDEAACERMSRALYQIGRPDSVRHPNDGTTHLFHWERDEAAGTWTVVVPEGFRIYVHPKMETELKSAEDREGLRAIVEATLVAEGKESKAVIEDALVAASREQRMLESAELLAMFPAAKQAEEAKR
jgi:hypothetical protein